MKKKIVAFRFSVSMSSGALACSNQYVGDETPSLATGGFIVEIKEGDYAAARNLLSKDASKMYSDDEFKKWHEQLTDEKTSIIPKKDSVKITGDTATEPVVITDGITQTTYQFS